MLYKFITNIPGMLYKFITNIPSMIYKGFKGLITGFKCFITEVKAVGEILYDFSGIVLEGGKEGLLYVSSFVNGVGGFCYEVGLNFYKNLCWLLSSTNDLINDCLDRLYNVLENSPFVFNFPDIKEQNNNDNKEQNNNESNDSTDPVQEASTQDTSTQDTSTQEASVDTEIINNTGQTEDNGTVNTSNDIIQDNTDKGVSSTADSNVSSGENRQESPTNENINTPENQGLLYISKSRGATFDDEGALKAKFIDTPILPPRVNKDQANSSPTLPPALSASLNEMEKYTQSVSARINNIEEKLLSSKNNNTGDSAPKYTTSYERGINKAMDAPTNLYNMYINPFSIYKAKTPHNDNNNPTPVNSPNDNTSKTPSTEMPVEYNKANTSQFNSELTTKLNNLTPQLKEKNDLLVNKILGSKASTSSGNPKVFNAGATMTGGEPVGTKHEGIDE
jgi:hypothetical protein